MKRFFLIFAATDDDDDAESYNYCESSQIHDNKSR